MKAINPAAEAPGSESLHYIGYSDDRGGVVSVVRALAGDPGLGCVMGVNPGFVQRRRPPIATLELPGLDGERLGLATIWHARAVARQVIRWIGAGPARVFHGHSRAGLAVALWLDLMGEGRAVASVHCYGRHRWFYRWSARRLGNRLFWLSPAMKRYYGIDGDTWDQCIPGCIPAELVTARARGRQPRDQVRLGGVGTLVPWKKWHLVLEAIACVPAASRLRLKFTHIGSAAINSESERYAAGLRARASELGIEGLVEWRGEQESTRDFLQMIDCLVIASENEPLSVAMFEAMAVGVPVLAADSGGATDAIIPARNGWLFRSGEAQDLARFLRLLADGDPSMDILPNPRDLDRFLAPTVTGQWAKVYASVLRTKQEQSRP